MSSGKDSGLKSDVASGAVNDPLYCTKLVAALTELGLSTAEAQFLAYAIRAVIRSSAAGRGPSNLHCCFLEGRLISTSETFTASSDETGRT